MNSIQKQKASHCVCGSAKAAEKCCLLIIKNIKKAESAEQLMRSRYTAYATKNQDYVLRSWHSSTRPAEIDLENNTYWTGLKVLSATPAESRVVEAAEAYVEFVADYVNNGQPGQMHERSRFLLEQGEWRYVDGEQLDSVLAGNKVAPGRNDPCYCGSGKKFKKCCINKT